MFKNDGIGGFIGRLSSRTAPSDKLLSQVVLVKLGNLGVVDGVLQPYDVSNSLGQS